MTSLPGTPTRAAQAFVGWLAWLAMRLTPPLDEVVVHGWPDGDENAVEVLKELERQTEKDIVLLVNKRGGWDERLSVEGLDWRHRQVPKNSLAGFVALVRSRVVMFTHGLGHRGRVPSSRVFVNLWHGDGPKRTVRPPGSSATYVVSSSPIWAQAKAEAFRIPTSQVSLTGNPRIDRMVRRSREDVFAQLGLAPHKKLILWLPTFRIGGDGGARTWHEGTPLSALDWASMPTDEVTVLLKPHPMDSDDYSSLPARVVTDATLARDGVSLYELLGAADGLVTDFSSVWIDFAPLDRPIAYFLPDLDKYRLDRGFGVANLERLLAGPVLADANELMKFMTELAQSKARRPSSYVDVTTVNAAKPGFSTPSLFSWLNQRHLDRVGHPLFDVHAAVHLRTKE